MSSAEVSTYLSAVKWGEEGHYLKEFTSKLKLPQAAKIIKGQHQSLGVPSLPSPHLSQLVLLASAGPRLKVVAQCVKFKEGGRRMVPVGPKLAVPEDYDGWFEILSEDGRAVRCIESVAELARRAPQRCLLRESLKVNLPKPDDAESVGDKTRTLCAGEVLTIGELVSGNSARNNRSGTGKYLSCTTAFSDAVFLPVEARCRFSSVAGEENISGVHSVRTLMAKRFPLMVRLVHGRPPAGLKAGSQFVHEMRLYSLIEEDSLVAMPLTSKADGPGGTVVVPLPANAPLKVLAPRNADALVKTPEHAALVARCQNLMTETSGCIQTCDVSSVREIRNPDLYQRHVDRDRLRSVPLVRRSASDPQGTAGGPGRIIHLERGMSTPTKTGANDRDSDDNSDDVRYDEIDQIYDYVRGFAPLPANIRNEFSAAAEDSSGKLPQINANGGGSSGSGSKPPEPPPIETIPVRKSGAGGTVKQPQPAPAPQKVTVSIVNRTPSLKAKEILLPHRSSRTKKAVEDHIYEKIGRRKNSSSALKLAEFFETHGRSHGPLRSNSASKVFGGHVVVCDSNNNSSGKPVPYRRTSQYQLHVNHGRSRFLKNSRNSCGGKDPLGGSRNGNGSTRWANSKTIATSPLFHIRYKSLTDLLMDGGGGKNSSPESSNTSTGRVKKADGGGGSAGSSSTLSSKNDNNNDNDAASPADEGFSDLEVQNAPTTKTAKNNNRRLSRPKSLSNLVGGAVDPKRRVDNHNYYNLVQNDLIKPPPPVELGCHKFYSMPDSTRFPKNHYSSSHAKKLGTLYL